MSKENQNQTNDNMIKDPKSDKDKKNSSFVPLNEKEQYDSRINPNLMNLQSSACKNLKNEMRSEPANFYA